jgi:hypothetical protein
LHKLQLQMLACLRLICWLCFESWDDDC